MMLTVIRLFESINVLLLKQHVRIANTDFYGHRPIMT